MTLPYESLELFNPDRWERTTAERIIRGKHKPNWGHWSISKECGRWEVREPFALRTTFGPPFPDFDTFDEAVDHVREQVIAWEHANPAWSFQRELFAPTSSPYTLSAAPQPWCSRCFRYHAGACR